MRRGLAPGAGLRSQSYPAVPSGGEGHVGVPEVHSVADHTPGHPVDDDDGAVGLDVVDQPNVGQAVVVSTISIAIIGLAEEDEIAGERPAGVVDSPVPRGEPVDGHHASVSLGGLTHRIDAQFAVGRPHQAGAVVVVAAGPDDDARLAQEAAGDLDRRVACEGCDGQRQWGENLEGQRLTGGRSPRCGRRTGRAASR